MDPAQLQPGYRLDRYELLCPLAYGGMASVWLARFGGRLGFERMVVIKMILPQYSQDPRFKEMFLDEARIASKIEHGNVARILDVGEEADNYFIVMEWVDGDSLSKIMREVETRKEKIPAGIAMRIVADAAAGLHAAHELKSRDGMHLGVVHRDVSPQNILVANNGTTMIIDFGVAKARDRLSQDTSAGQLKGKIRYMAPEQALGRAVDHRADVWALGAMLYEMFVGAPPYDGPNEVATLHKLTSGQRPAPMPTDIPEVIRSIVTRTLGYEADDRFESALELNVALENAMLEINEPTSTAMVAAYTAELLRDRKAARREAVDAALEKARRRDERRAASMQVVGSDGSAGSSSGVSSTASGNSRILSSPPPPNDSSAPSRTGERMGLGETPSSATLGSANMEYFPDHGVEEVRDRRYVMAAGLGVAAAAAVIGIFLMVRAVGPAQKPEPPLVDLPPALSVSVSATAPTTQGLVGTAQPSTAQPSDTTPAPTAVGQARPDIAPTVEEPTAPPPVGTGTTTHASSDSHGSVRIRTGGSTRSSTSTTPPPKNDPTPAPKSTPTGKPPTPATTAKTKDPYGVGDL